MRLQAHELAAAGGEGRLARAALERLLPRRERVLLAEALRAEGEAGVQEAAAEVKGWEEAGAMEAEEVEAEEEEAAEVEWLGGVPLLVFLALNGLEACALCLLPHLPNTALHVSAADADGFTALHCAANLRLPRLAAALLMAGAPVDSSTSDVSLLGEPGGRSPLHLAAAAGATAIASMLLGAKAARRAEDWQGATPFLLACRRGHMAVAQLLTAAARGAAAARAEGGEEAEEAEEAEGGEEAAEEAPCEQELRGFELVEGIAVRARAAARLRIDDRPKLHAPFELAAPLLSVAACASLVAEAEAVAARQGGWDSTRHKNHPTVDMPAHALSLASYHRVRRAIDNVVLPQMQARYAYRLRCANPTLTLALALALALALTRRATPAARCACARPSLPSTRPGLRQAPLRPGRSRRGSRCHLRRGSRCTETARCSTASYCSTLATPSMGVGPPSRLRSTRSTPRRWAAAYAAAASSATARRR